MAAPRVPQGNLNRLRASLVLNDVASLNVIPSNLGVEGIALIFDGEATTQLPTMTGQVNSPEPYQPVTVQIHLLKTQQLAASYEERRQTNSLLGEGTVRPDVSAQSSGIGPYQLENLAIRSVGELRLNGTDAGYRVTLTGFYIINNSLYDGGI